MAESFFEILGVPRRYHLSDEEMERAFHERSRVLHPDRHMKADPQTRVKNALATSQLNEAYRTLKNGTKRAEYLLKLEGIELSDERSGHKVDPAFLMEILELREALAEARGDGDAARVTSLGAEVKARRDEVLADVDAGFSRYEAGDRGALKGVADALVAERYFKRFLEEVEAFEDAQHGADRL